MKKTFLIALVLLAFALNGYTQSCLPNGITFTTQSDIDNFATNYPGCTMIEGDVIITAYPNQSTINNLQGLAMLTAIGGRLLISDHPNLTSLQGLDNLTSVGKDLQIEYLNAVPTLTGLQNLTIIGGDLTIKEVRVQDLSSLSSLTSVGGIWLWYNPVLTHFGTFQNLTKLDGGLVIVANPSFESLSGLENLTSVYGINISNNPPLTSLSPLANLKTVSSSLQITAEPLLTDLSGLEQITSIGGTLELTYLQVFDFDALENLTSVGGRLIIEHNPSLSSLDGLKNIEFVGNDITITDLPGITSLLPLGKIVANTSNPNAPTSLTVANMYQLTNLDGLEHVSIDGGYLTIRDNPALTNIGGLENIGPVRSANIFNNDALVNLHGLENLSGIPVSDLNLWISNNASLTGLEALSNLTTRYLSLYLDHNPALTNLNGLEKITEGSFIISNNQGLSNLSGLENVTSVGSLTLIDNASLNDLSALDNLTSGWQLMISNNPSLTNLNGLDNLAFNGSQIHIEGNAALTSLTGLGNVMSIADSLIIVNNPALTSLDALTNLTNVGAVQIVDNAMLSDCSIFAVCNNLLNNPWVINIGSNSTGCNTSAEVAATCQSSPVTVFVTANNNGTPIYLENMIVSLTGSAQMNLKPTDANGEVHFAFVDSGNFEIGLPEVPADRWQISKLVTTLTSSMGLDSVVVFLELTPIWQCPELSVKLGMPSFFRGCLTTSDLEVSTQNTGTITAEGVKVAVVIPPVLELLASAPLLDAQSGDTLYFDLGDLLPFGKSNVMLTVRTRCDTFLLGQTLCLETFATMDNDCPSVPFGFSEIKLSAKCLGDTMVRFTMKNIGVAPTQGLHEYKVIRNDAIHQTNSFNLAAEQLLVLDFPADGSTWRMEATKFDDGTETAVALENCNGLTPGLINAFWLDHGPLEYDFDCRQVIGSFDPNLKSAVPTGASWSHIIEANQSLQYTIDFQNTGSDTAFRVLLRDVLPTGLDFSSFRPGYSSHPCTWEVKGNTLEVLFSPIALPDSNVNEPASHGFFSFNINQEPNLPLYSYLQNTAFIIFDFNPPIYTNTVYHQIGKLTVKVDEPQAHAALWHVLGNPTRDVATFRAMEEIAGEKQFDLYDAAGRLVRSAQFSGQAFEFQRDMLAVGVYFFRIVEAKGRVFSGKIVVTD